MDRTLFIDEAAALLGVSRRTVYYRIREGRLLTIRTRCGSQRVLLSSIEALLQGEAEKRRTPREAAAGELRAPEPAIPFFNVASRPDQAVPGAHTGRVALATEQAAAEPRRRYHAAGGKEDVR